MMRVVSYNVRGLRVGPTAADKARRLVVNNLLKDCEILCLQETFLPKQDLDKLNSFNDNFHGAGESTTDLSRGIVRGRIAGGVAILWHKKLDAVINVIRLDVDWCIAVKVKCDDREFVILNVYMPFESQQNEDEFMHRLGFISSFIMDNSCTSVYVVGDMNADLSDSKSLFANHMLRFCDDNNIILSSQKLLPPDSYSYISEAWHTTSWLDHCLCTADAHSSVTSMKILYEASITDHVPLAFTLDASNIPEMASEVNGACQVKISWNKLTQDEVFCYYGRTDVLLSEVQLPLDAVMCSDLNCNNTAHCKDLCAMYDSIVNTLYVASRPLLTYSDKAHTIMPGWNHYVADYHEEAKGAHKTWVQAGRPRQGPDLEYKKLTNARYKYAVRHVQKNEQAIRADAMARKLLVNDITSFWKEVKLMNRSNTVLPCTVEGVSGTDNIAELWRKHYSGLFNCIQSDHFKLENIHDDTPVNITTKEVYEAIMQLSDNKACGLDQITAEHLKLSSPKVAALLAICFNGLMTHGILPDSMLSVTLVPVIKDKAGKVGSVDNYRPIALASVISKVLERIILDRLEAFISTNDNQFGFKAKHSTDLCIFALKDIVETFRRQNSSVLVGFIDASKAFDRVNHCKLFNKLSQRGVPGCIIRILAYWYARQTMQVKWGNSLSSPFGVSNGVRQGGLLSPALFNLYMDDLSNQLRECRTGCMIGSTLINHIMYADDLAILSPSSAGFQHLLNVCSSYGIEFDVKYNAKKSVVLICRTEKDKCLKFPPFYLSGQSLLVCDKTKYLGHIITDRMTDDEDMFRQCRMLYAQANMLIRKFHFCSDEVKTMLFRAYCTPLYTAPLWVKFQKASFHKLQVAYNDCYRILMKKPRWTSTSELFCKAGVSTLKALLRHLMYSFICRLNKSQNQVIVVLTNPSQSSMRYTSGFWKYWYKCLL